MLRILKDYLELARPEHLRIDFMIPFIIGSITIVGLSFMNVNLNELISKAGLVIGVVITAFSILAGFNATSLSIFASSNSSVVKELKEQLIDGTSRSKIEQLFAYFTWSVIVQLTLLFYSIVAFSVFSYIPLYKYLKYPILNILLWLIVWVGFVGILYSILLTIRNVTILYYYLIADSRN